MDNEESYLDENEDYSPELVFDILGEIDEDISNLLAEIKSLNSSHMQLVNLFLQHWEVTLNILRKIAKLETPQSPLFNITPSKN